MPRIGGEELIRRLHQLDPSTRVLVCSAYVQDEALRELLRSGHYRALPKPFSQAQLLESVTRALSSVLRKPEDLTLLEGAYYNPR